MSHLSALKRWPGLPSARLRGWRGERFARAKSAAAPLTEEGGLNFGDHAAAFRSKSTLELLRSLAILKLCSVDLFVDNSLKIMRTFERLLGARLFSALLRPTFYGQFVGGETREQLTRTADRLAAARLGLMVCPVHEEDVEEEGEEELDEEKYERNTEYIVGVAETMGAIAERQQQLAPHLQCKITAFMSAKLVKSLSDHLLHRRHSLGGLSGELSRGLDDQPVSPAGLSPDESEHLRRGLSRLSRLCRRARSGGLRVLVDAEYTYLNPGVSAVALAMMRRFNRDGEATVANTYQCYLKSAFDTISSDKALADQEGFLFAVKLVRGAYLEKERLLSRTLGYPDPVNPTYESTGAMYDRVCEWLLRSASPSTSSSPSSSSSTLGFLVVATHNESSVRRAAELAGELGLLPPPPRAPGSAVVVSFAQIYGMSDQISLPLGARRVPVYKSVPFGPASEVLPYLSRRAAENRAVVAGARRERQLLAREVCRRMLQITARTRLEKN